MYIEEASSQSQLKSISISIDVEVNFISTLSSHQPSTHQGL